MVRAAMRPPRATPVAQDIPPPFAPANANMTQRLDDLKTNVCALEGNSVARAKRSAGSSVRMRVVDAVAAAVLTIVLHFAHY
jgi:hypothetical protein